MMVFDPRTIGEPVYKALTRLREPYEQLWHNAEKDEQKKTYYNHLKEQKSQAVELYTYLSTWGLLRLRAEEIALDKRKLGEPKKQLSPEEKANKKNQQGKREVLQEYFGCLETLSDEKNITLDNLKNLDSDKYLGLMGLGLSIAQEFSFWANVVYHDISGDD
ncbi:MAG: hypothetical protein F6J96_19845 [Symploca sp. SIO1C2]|nr:hypothetical protein [Symploca sp. SIO1C2]